MIISISGRPGSGKSTIGKMLAKKLGYDYISVGDLRGEIASEKGMTIDELNELGLEQSWTDKEVDKKTEELGKTKDNLVVDGRMAWYFIPDSIKVFFDVDLNIAAERIFKNQRPDEKPVESIREMKQVLSNRMENTQKRLKKWYGVNYLNFSNYDILIDTTGQSPESVLEKLLLAIDKLKKEKSGSPNI